jgi:hypothetical protein
MVASMLLFYALNDILELDIAIRPKIVTQLGVIKCCCLQENDKKRQEFQENVNQGSESEPTSEEQPLDKPSYSDME